MILKTGVSSLRIIDSKSINRPISAHGETPFPIRFLTAFPFQRGGMMRFARVYGVRIVIGAMLATTVFWAMRVYAPYRREQQIAHKIEATRGWVRSEYCGPTWIPILSLQGTEVTDVGLGHVVKLTSLTVLSLGFTEITDAGLERL